MTTMKTQAPILKLERTFKATPEKLWSYWTDPAKYAKWFNPAPIDLVIHEFDARPGGKIRFDMPQPDGNKNPQEGVFHSLSPYTEIVSGAPDRSFLITTRFAPVNAHETKMTVEVVGVPPEWHAMATQGWGQGFAKLERVLAAGPVAANGFTIERTFKAAPEKVWKMWTTPEGIMKWWAPSASQMGYEFAVLKMDVRVGGKYAFSMKGNGHDLVNGGTYTRVEPHDELAWTWHYDIFLAPGEKAYDVPIVVTLAKTAAGGTKMTFIEGPLAKPEFTEGSKKGVEQNVTFLAKALGE